MGSRREKAWTDKKANRHRLYLVVQESYVIWLDRRKDEAWKFSTAYCAGRSDIQRYTQGGVRIWKK